MSALLRAQAVAKTYRTRHGVTLAMARVDLDIDDGEFVAVVGPSGCGKSTLLRILGGLVAPSAGQVHLAGAPMVGPHDSIGMVFQGPVLLPWRTVLDNVLLPAEIKGLPGEAARQRALALLEVTGLAGFGERFPHELSGGMQQRAAIVRALVHDPRVLLMDEPFGALDALTREQMNLEIARIWQGSGKTVVFVTHSISEAVFLADRVLVMSARPGRVRGELRIDLPRPRTLDVINTPRFGDYAGQIRGWLNAAGDLS